MCICVYAGYQKQFDNLIQNKLHPTVLAQVDLWELCNNVNTTQEYLLQEE